MDAERDTAWQRRAGRRTVLGAAGATIVAGAVAGLGRPASAETVIAKNGTGTSAGYFYSLWKDGGAGTAAMTLGAGGDYTATWDKVDDVIMGTGWRTGSRRSVSYSSTFAPVGNAYICLYGWIRSPLAEYYVVENWGSYRPTGTLLGTVASDGATYEIFKHQYSFGINPCTTYTSVRQSRRTAGTITTGNHFDAWARYGLKIDTFDYMLMATEGYQSSGRSSVKLLSSP